MGIESAVRTWTAAVESKMGDFAKRQKSVAEDLAEMKARLGGDTGSREQKQYLGAFLEAMADPDGKGYSRAREAQLDLKVISETEDVGGGLAVPEQLSEQIYSYAYDSAPHLRRIGIETVKSTDYKRIVTIADGVANAVGETGTRSATAHSTFISAQPSWGEYYSLTQAYRWAVEDIPNFVAWLTRDAGRQIAKKLGQDVFNGGGSGAVKGIFHTAPSASADDASPQRDQYSIQKVAATASASPMVGITATDLSLLMDEFDEDYLTARSFAFVMRNSTWRTMAFSDPTQALLMPKPAAVYGLDVLLTGTADPIAADEFPVVAGDWEAGYCLVTRGPLKVLRDDVSTKGISTFYISGRFGGCVADHRALKCLSI